MQEPSLVAKQAVRRILLESPQHVRCVTPVWTKIKFITISFSCPWQVSSFIGVINIQTLQPAHIRQSGTRAGDFVSWKTKTSFVYFSREQSGLSPINIYS